MAGLEVVGGPDVRDGQEGRGQLVEDGGGRGGQVGGEDAGAEVDEVEGDAGDGGGFFGVRGCKAVVEAVGLEEVVAALGDGHGGQEARFQPDGFQVGDVLGEEGVDFGFGFVEVGRGVQGRVVRDDGVVDLAVDQLDDAVDEVAELGEQLAVVLIDEGSPFELGVARFRPVFEQVVAPDVSGHARVLGVVAEDADAAGFGEFAAFVVEVFGCGEVVEHGPFVFGADL